MAGNVNSVFLQGRLTKDPELRYTPGGTAVCEFTIAVNRYYRDSNDEQQEETLFAPITTWGRQAENCGEYLSKGRETIIEGRLQMDQWETEDGENRSKLKVVARNVQFIGGGGQAPNTPGPQGGQEAKQTAASANPDQANDGAPIDDEGEEDEDFSDIPF